MKRFSHLVLLSVMVAGLVLYGCVSDSDPADGDVVDGDVTESDTADGDDTDGDDTDQDVTDGDADGDATDTDGDITDGDGSDGDAVDEDPVEQPDLEPGMIQLNGSVEKGPFVLGSSITISPVDGNGNPTGQQFTTQTFNDMGEFSVNFEASGFVSLEGSGFYYNEVTGDLSGANLTLRAFYEIVADGAQNAHLNLLTHLTYNRVKNLVQAGTTFSEAIAQAEGELVAALPIGPDDFSLDDPAIELTLQGGDTLANAYLFAVSSVLAHAARLRSPGSPDAALQELINGISADLAANGELSATTVQTLVDAQVLPAELDSTSGVQYLIPGEVMAGLEARFDSLGSTAVVPDLNRVLDSDFDSVANAEDNCWWLPNPDQTDDNDNDIGDACDIVYEDPDTGLMWLNISTYLLDEFPLFDGEADEAATYCDELDIGGYTDWRLPSLDALRSVIHGCDGMESNSVCGLHNNCQSTGCETSCTPCTPGDANYWKPGMLGVSRTWSSGRTGTRYWSLDFKKAEFTTLVVLEGEDDFVSVRCVRGYSQLQELICDDGIDDDGDSLTDCADDDCFAISHAPATCGNVFDLSGLNSQEFLQCRDWMNCNVISSECGECIGVCLWDNCHNVCEEGGFNEPECQVCQQNCLAGECFGSFICDMEYLCMDNVDQDQDSLTDMSDPDCQRLASGQVLPDGDVDDDSDSEVVVNPTESPVIDGDSATFYYVPPDGSPTNSVWIVGDFLETPWNPASGIMMLPISGTNVWTATVEDLPCGEHLYKYYLQPGSQWITDPLNPVNDGDPNYNSVFIIEDNCVADGDVDVVDIEPEIEEEAGPTCDDLCGGFAGTYCTDSVVSGGDPTCGEVFAQGVDMLRFQLANSDTCMFTAQYVPYEYMHLADVSGCDFSNVEVMIPQMGSCLLSADSDSGTVTVACRGGACTAELTQNACGAVDGDEDTADPEPEPEPEEEAGCPVACDDFAGRYCMLASEGELCSSVFPEGPGPIFALSYPENSCGFVLGETSDPETGVYATVESCEFENQILSRYGVDVECLATFSAETGEIIVTCTDYGSCIVTMNKAACEPGR